MKNKTNIFMAGMGGQGIAFLSRILIESLIKAAYPVFGCDTHGMSQRGGSVVSHLRIGDNIFTPIIPKGQADIILGLERLETLRAMETMGRENTAVFFYDAVYHPTSVRVNKADYPEINVLKETASKKTMALEAVYYDNIPDPRMQNTALLGRLIASRHIPKLSLEIVLQTMDELLPQHIKRKNMELLKKCSGLAAKA